MNTEKEIVKSPGKQTCPGGRFLSSIFDAAEQRVSARGAVKLEHQNQYAPANVFGRKRGLDFDGKKIPNNFLQPIIDEAGIE